MSHPRCRFRMNAQKPVLLFYRILAVWNNSGGDPYKSIPDIGFSDLGSCGIAVAGGNATSAKADQKLCEVKPARSSFHSLGQSMDASPQTTLSPREVKEAAALEKLRRGALKRAPPFVVLVGLPGSGKSTFGTALAVAGWDRVSQDEMGGKGARNVILLDRFSQS